MTSSLEYSVHQYGAHELQRVGVWDLDIADKDKYWIVYIHGGAWRDPRIAHETFAPSITRILESDDPSSKDSIAAFASIDYRLSPHPDFPQDPSATPPEQFRGARHPDHLDDVRAAIAFLQRRFAFGARYVLLGHSAGGTLAYQLLATTTTTPDPGFPEAVFGVEGIYDMAGLDARVGGAYAGFLSAAFGPREHWDEAAPMKSAGRFADRFAGLAVLGHSPDDELVDMPEAEGMAARLRGDLDADKVLLLRDLEGTHDHVWQDGRGVARIVLRILALLRGPC
ncbi:alpha/beta-hydrolase [Jackrogersella minutella]|nr:alpha/beta-hydrolase [Jackrogersella minutella]